MILYGRRQIVKKIWTIVQSLLLMIALMGCNSSVPEATPEIGDDFLYHFEVVTQNPTVGEEITILATVTNLTGYTYWIKTGEELFYFSTENTFIQPDKFNRSVKFSQNATLTSVFQVTYDSTGHYVVRINGEFIIDDCQFGYAKSVSVEVLEPVIPD